MSTDRKEALAALELQAKAVTDQAVKQARKHGSTQKHNNFESLLESLNNPDDHYLDNVVAPPRPNDDMFYGFTGEIAQTAAQGTEVNPVAAAMVFLSFLGAYVGRDTFLHINNTIHHPRLFTLHIGRSGTGKGDAQQLIWRVMRRINEVDSGLLGGCHSGGLSTREGLIMLMHDGIGETPAILDKRLWIVESEFANVLHQSKREGNTLSSCLREMWDGSSSSPATKSSRIACTAPHIGMHANITPSELNALLSSKEMSNGFANRFLMVWAENIGNVPFPKTTPQLVVNAIADEIMQIIDFAKGGYPNVKDTREMSLSEAAKDYYASIYPKLNAPVGNDFLTGMLNRRKPYVLRLGMLFALTDMTLVIEEKHLVAAYAWVNYAIDTVRFVFADKASSPEQAETRQNAEKILHWLELNPNGATATQLSNDCFNRNIKAQKIQRALTLLLSDNPPKIDLIEGETGSKGGRPVKKYKLKSSTNLTKKPQNPVARGLHGFKANEKTTKELRKNPLNKISR